MSGASTVYFPNLNALRCFAAFAVVVHHTEQIKHIFGLPNVWDNSPAIYRMGGLGVALFFVLSGFLITYLLLEEERRGGIQIGKFYLRRMLRIWPLYYLIVFLALCVLPFISAMEIPGFPQEEVHSNLKLKALLFGLGLPNVMLAYVGVVPYVSQTWSIGTEEQFYLLWPFLIKAIRSKLTLMFGVIVLYFSVWYAAPPLQPFLSWLPIHCMAIGGMSAVLLHQKRRSLNLFLNIPVFYVTLAAVALLLALGVKFPFLDYEIYSVLFSVLILNFAANKNIGWSLEFQPLHYLGKISYGIYMYHPITIVACIQLLLAVGSPDAHRFSYPLIVLVTIATAALSYHGLEAFFLRMKPVSTRGT